MRILTVDEARDWCGRRRGLLNAEGLPNDQPTNLHGILLSYENQPAGKLYFLSRSISTLLDYWEEALLWITETGVWSSSENLHLYYRLRQGYGDLRHIDQAPVHLLLTHESADLTTLVHLVMLNGWDAFLVTSRDFMRVHLSHDGCAELWFPEESNLEPARRELANWGAEVKVLHPAA